jgi:hypothetical protein
MMRTERRMAELVVSAEGRATLEGMATAAQFGAGFGAAGRRIHRSARELEQAIWHYLNINKTLPFGSKLSIRFWPAWPAFISELQCGH